MTTALFAIPGGTHAGSYPIVASYNGTALFSASSDSSGMLKIDKSIPTVNWSNPADIQYGTALGPAQLNAAASVPGLFVYNPPSGTVLSAGLGQALSVTFTPSDGADYNSAAAAVSINVLPAPLTVTANNASRRYGQVNPSFTASYSGFVNGENTSVVGGTLSCTSTATPSSSVVGSPYPINCSGLTAANYAINYVAGQLTITPAPLTITANNATKILNAALPPLSGFYSGFVAGDTPASLTGTLNCSSSATASSPVGTYSVACSGQSSGNYTIRYVAGILKITYNVCLLYDPTHAVHSGAVIPIKLQLCDANGNDASSSGVVVTATGVVQVSTGATDAVQDAGNSNPDNNFRFDGGRYIFDLKTTGLPTGTYSLNFTAGNDPQPHAVLFQVR
jgi:hypothetical protein